MALTIPAVTVFSKPNGEPIATTHSPTRSLLGSPKATFGSALASILSTATSVRRSVPMTLALNSRLSVKPHGDLVGRLHDVGIGEDVAVLADDEARAERARLVVPRLRRAEAPEEIEERILFGCRRQAFCLAADGRGGADIHHGRPLPVGEVGEVGQTRGSAPPADSGRQQRESQ